MSESVDGVNVISTGSGESEKGGIDVVVGGLGSETLIGNSDGDMNEADGVRVLNGEPGNEAGKREDGCADDADDGSVVKQPSGDDGMGMMGLVGRLLGGEYGVDKKVGGSSSGGGRVEAGMNRAVAVGEVTCVSGADINGKSADVMDTDGNAMKEHKDTVSSALHGNVESVTIEQVLDAKSDAKEVENVQADVLRTEGGGKQDSVSNELGKDGKSETEGADDAMADVLMNEDGKRNSLTTELMPDGKVEIEEVDDAVADVLMTEGDGKQVSTTIELARNGKSGIKEVHNVDTDMLMIGGNGEQSATGRNGEYSASDIVWGKVRSHPWWPGQIFAPSDASDKAAKYLKKDSYLIAYFGDQTFAWNEVSKIKPFHMNFTEMEKQNNTEGFLHAVSCALDEVSRRVEVGLSCGCLPEDVSNKIKTQEFLNAGIRQESIRREVRDKSFTAASFVPEKLLEFVVSMAEVPGSKTDRLQLATMKAQLLGFNRWKGRYQLPLLEEFGELVDEDNQFVAKGERSGSDGVLPTGAGVNEVRSRKRKSTAPDVSSQKRKRPSFDEKLTDTKEKQISALMSSSSPKSDGDKIVKKCGRKEKLESASSMPNNPKIDGDETVKKRGRKRKLEPASPESDGVSTLKKRGRKRKLEPASSIPDNLEVERQENPKSSGAADQTPLLRRRNPGVGKRLCRAIKSAEKLQSSVTTKSRGEIVLAANSLTPDEIFSKLSFSARNPMQAHDILVPVDALLREFRNSVCLEKPLPQSRTPHVNEGKQPCNSETKDVFAFDGTEDPDLKGAVIQNSSQSKMLSEPHVPAGESAESGMDITGNVNFDDDKEKDPVLAADDSRPTALILVFSNVESIPPVSNLNEIFRPFGPLKESETEILVKSKRAKVIFEKKADADAAFSSTGKYQTFGPSLVSYRLNYAPSPRKASAAPKRNKKKNP